MEMRFMAKKVIIILAALVALVCLILAVQARSAARSWQQHLAELRAAGEPLTFPKIQARRRPVLPSGDTVADVLTRVADKVKTSPGPVSRGVLGMFDGPSIDFFTGIPADAIETTREYLAARRPVLVELGDISGLEPGRLAISYDGSPTNIVTRFAKVGPPIRRIIKLLYLDATLKLIDRDTEAAASVIPLQLKAVSPLADEPVLLAHLIRIATAATAVRTLENTLRVGTLSNESLRHLDADFADYLAAHSMKWALCGERAWFIGLSERFRGLGGIRGVILTVTTRGDPEQGTEMFGRLIDATDEPARLLGAAKRIESQLPKLSKSRMFTSMSMMGITRSVVLHVRGLAEIKAARIAIAAERFRLQEGRLPEGLDELVPAHLSEIPLDPFDGLPMKLARTGAGLVIYSVGSDGIDNGGRVVPNEGEKKPRDWGFRLLNIEERGLVLVDQPPTDGG